MRLPYSTSRMIGIGLVLVCAAFSLAGCGTLHTYWQYQDYSDCLESCERFQDDSFKQQCRSRCYKRFDWSQSPLLATFQNLEDERQRPSLNRLRNKTARPR